MKDFVKNRQKLILIFEKIIIYACIYFYCFFERFAGPVLLELGSGVKHWTLLFVSLLDQTVTYIDPFGANRSKCEDVRLN